MSDPGLGRPPLRLLLPAAAAAAFLVLPLVGLVTQAPWGRLVEIATSEPALEALWLSVWTSTLAALACAALGLPLAWVLARLDFPGRGLLRAAITVPLVLPPVVGGVALLTVLGRSGLVGEVLGLRLPYTSTAVVLAHTFVALPFFVLAAEGALRAVPARLEVAAATLGAGRWTAFTRVALPLARPGIVAGLVLAWARSLGEFGATITFAGNYPGTTQTLTLLVYQELQDDRAAAVALSLVLLGVCVVVLALLRDRWLTGAVR